jgi:hypothetical protein
MIAHLPRIMADGVFEALLGRNPEKETPPDEYEPLHGIYIGKPCLRAAEHGGVDCHSITANPIEWCDTCREYAGKIGETVN